MSDIEKLFLAAYPLWPKSMLKKFESMLHYELAAINKLISPEIVDKYYSLGGVKQYLISEYIQNIVTIYNPLKESDISKKYLRFRENVKWAIVVDAQSSIHPDLYAPKNFNVTAIFDKRLIRDFQENMQIVYSEFGDKYQYQYNLFGGAAFAIVKNVLPEPVLLLNIVINSYVGAESVLVMIENGVPVDVDEKLLREFVTFINAYKKYSGQLVAAKSFENEKNKQDLREYKNSIDEKLASRKNELNDLRIQIAFAAKNENASAKRDMQNLSIVAQSLILQLKDRIGASD